MNRFVAGSFVVLLVAPSPARAQVYPERVLVKAKAGVATAYQRRDRGGDDREAQSERTTKTFRLGANGSISLGNIAGDITVTRGAGSDTTVEIVKTARGRDVNDARELLQLVAVDASERAGRVEVRTHYPGGDEMRRNNRRNFNVEVAYNVTAPAGVEVTANSVSGDIRASGGARVTSAKSVSGSIEIADVRVDDLLEASSVSGDVKLRHVAAKRIQTGSVSGDLALDDVQTERVTASTTSGNITFSGPLARSGRYELKGFSGDVHLVVAGNTGFELDARTFSGQIRSDDFPVTARGRINRRSLNGTYGDGSAVLDLSTFSGSILITKR